jgi:hypothetical protein
MNRHFFEKHGADAYYGQKAILGQFFVLMQ